MTRVLSSVFALGLVAWSAGCAEDDPQDVLRGDIDAYVTELNAQVDVTCDCSDEFTFDGVTFDDKAACKTGLGEVLPARRRCIDDAFNQDVAASQSWIDCVLPLMQELTTCLNTKLSCDDPSSIAACGDDFELGEDNCIGLPNSVQRDQEDCFE